jgi:hypothetical protein
MRVLRVAFCDGACDLELVLVEMVLDLGSDDGSIMDKGQVISWETSPSSAGGLKARTERTWASVQDELVIKKDARCRHDEYRCMNPI